MCFELQASDFEFGLDRGFLYNPPVLTFTPISGSAVRCRGSERDVCAFADKADGGALLLKSSPEETTQEGVVSWPGEYDVTGIAIRGIGQKDGQQVSYMTVVDGTRCAFLSSPLMDWTDPELESLGDVDVMIAPAEEAKILQKLVEEIDPRVLILVPGAKGKMDPDALKACGAQGKSLVSEHKVKGLPAEGREVVVLGK
jgi:hypothetical protein